MSWRIKSEQDDNIVTFSVYDECVGVVLSLIFRYKTMLGIFDR